MSSSKAQSSVLLAMTTTVGMVYTARLISKPGDILRNPGSMLRIFVGGVAATLGLMFLAYPQPELARMFAWFIAFGTFMTYGAPILAQLNTVLTQSWTVTDGKGKDPNKRPATTDKPPVGSAPSATNAPGAGVGGGGGGGAGW